MGVLRCGMAAIYRMSSKMQADRAVLRLMQAGIPARLLPGRPTESRGQWLEADVDDVERAAVLEVIHRVDPAAQDQGPLA